MISGEDSDLTALSIPVLNISSSQHSVSSSCDSRSSVLLHINPLALSFTHPSHLSQSLLAKHCDFAPTQLFQSIGAFVVICITLSTTAPLPPFSHLFMLPTIDIHRVIPFCSSLSKLSWHLLGREFACVNIVLQWGVLMTKGTLKVSLGSP